MGLVRCIEQSNNLVAYSTWVEQLCKIRNVFDVSDMKYNMQVEDHKRTQTFWFGIFTWLVAFCEFKIAYVAERKEGRKKIRKWRKERKKERKQEFNRERKKERM